ncbi:MAG: GGDEF domain-containing protein [Bacteroidales bacterium]|jgi:diguanylate cyclase (GGDEF)-like protein
MENSTNIDKGYRQHPPGKDKKPAAPNPMKVMIGANGVFSDISSYFQLLKEAEKLKKEVYIDTLTKIGNRKYFEMVFQSKMYELKTLNIPFGLIFFDIDNFKDINDIYGHNLGDNILKMVAENITRISRSLDTICRWGGDEFILIISYVDKIMLQEFTERLRIFIQNICLLINTKERLSITVSIGATIVKPNDTIETSVKRADELMYKSKKEGKNKINIG